MAKDVFTKVATKAISYVLDKSKRKISGQGIARAGKRFILFISNEDMGDIIKSRFIPAIFNMGPESNLLQIFTICLFL